MGSRVRTDVGGGEHNGLRKFQGGYMPLYSRRLHSNGDDFGSIYVFSHPTGDVFTIKQIQSVLGETGGKLLTIEDAIRLDGAYPHVIDWLNNGSFHVADKAGIFGPKYKGSWYRIDHDADRLEGMLVEERSEDSWNALPHEQKAFVYEGNGPLQINFYRGEYDGARLYISGLPLGSRSHMVLVKLNRQKELEHIDAVAEVAERSLKLREIRRPTL